MVLEDIYRPPKKSPRRRAPMAESLAAQLASPLDRLAAVIADFIIFIPIATLLIAPMRRQVVMAQLQGQSEEWTWAIVGCVVVATLTILLYQTIFVSMFGATPGKMFMGLKVVSVWDQGHPRWLHAFWRSCVWCVEWVFLGIPLVALFWNSHRRSLHDRVADTCVIACSKKRAAGPPNPFEISLAGGANAAFLLFMTFMLFWNVQDSQDPDRQSARLIQDLEDENFLCAEVGEAHRQWRDLYSSQTPSRMDVALALFAADAIDEECLNAEAYPAVWKGQDQSLAYLAKSLIQSNQPELRQKYAQKACEKNAEGPACRLVRILDLASAEEAETTEPDKDKQAQAEALTLAITEKDPAFLRVYAIKNLMQTRLYQAAWPLLQSVAPHRFLSFFYSSERIRALWRMDQKEQARSAFLSSFEGSTPAQKLDMASWQCVEEIQNGCGQSVQMGCEVVQKNVRQTPSLVESGLVAVALLESAQCHSSKEEITDLQKRIKSKTVAQFLKTLNLVRDGQKEKAREILSAVIESEAEGSGPLFFEAQIMLARLAPKSDALDELVKEWRDSTDSEEWPRWGASLVQRYLELEDNRRAFEIGELLAVQRSLEPVLGKKLAIVAFRTGDWRRAQNFVAQLPSGQARDQTRTPASAVENFSLSTQADDPEIQQIRKSLEFMSEKDGS